MKGGYIKLHRQILESELWSKPAEWFKIWNYVLLSVNYSDSGSLKAGQGFFKYDIIAKECGCSYRTVENFFRWAEQVGMVWKQKSTRGAVITVLSWDKFQTDVDTGVDTGVEITVDTITKEEKNKEYKEKKTKAKKEKVADAPTDAERVASEYKELIGGDMSNASKNISYWLKQFSADELIYSIRKYKDQLVDKNTDKQYFKKCSNFFGVSDKDNTFFKQFMTQQEDKKADIKRQMENFLWEHYEGIRIRLNDGRSVLVNACSGTMYDENNQAVGRLNTEQAYSIAVMHYKKYHQEATA